MTREQWFHLNDILQKRIMHKQPLPPDLHKLMKNGLQPLDDKAAEENRAREAQRIIDRESHAR